MAIEAAGARVVLVGGMAMVVHGIDATTQDFDLSFATDPENLECLNMALRQLAAHPARWSTEVPFNVDQVILGLPFLHLETSAGQVDLLMKTPPVSFEALWEQSVEIDLGQASLRVASLEHLIAMKSVSTREKDVIHLGMLKRLAEEER